MDCKLLFEHVLFFAFFLKTAEEYLTEAEGEVTDVESVMTEKSNTESELSSNYGKLKHSDSLLLLTQVRVCPQDVSGVTEMASTGMYIVRRQIPDISTLELSMSFG